MKTGADTIDPRELVSACRRMTIRLQHAVSAEGLDLAATHWLNPPALRTQINDLREGLNRLTFSPAYDRWSAYCRRALIDRLCADPEIYGTIKNWETAPLEDRKKVTVAIGENLADIFSMGNRLFPAKKIAFEFASRAAPPGKAPYFERGRTVSSLTEWLCRIKINTHYHAGFGDGSIALDTAFHESLHVMHLTLADYFRHCANPRQHSLGGDMAMLAASSRLDYAATLRFRALYHAVPIERDAHHQARQFTRDLAARIHQTERTSNAIHPA